MIKPFLILFAAALCLSGCGLKDAIDAVPEMRDSLQDGMNDQKKLIPLKELLNNDNYDELNPVPTKLIPWGKKLAEIITPSEVVELTFLWLKAIDEVNPAPDQDDAGVDVAYTHVQVQSINRSKLGRLYALMTVAGFLPEETVSKIIEQEIYGYGRYQKAAFQLLTLRAEFINDVLLDASLLSKPLDTVGALKQAVVYTDSLERIARMGFADHLSLKTVGFLKPMEQIEFKVDTHVALSNWNRILLSAQKDIVLNQDKFTGDPREDKSRFAKMKRDYDSQIQIVQQRIRGWGQ